MNARNPRVIQLDPFFDGDMQGNVQQASPQNGSGYVTPDAETMTRMRMGPAGLRGTVIPHATLGGIPQGTRPHSTQNVMVHIDPHIEGQTSSIRLGDLSNNLLAQANQLASEITPEPTDMATLRLRGAAAMHAASRLIGQTAQPRQAPQAMQEMPMMEPYQQPVVPVQMPPQQQRQPQPQRRMSPLTAFNQPVAPLPNTREMRQIDFREPLDAGPPSIEVTFEMEHFGEMTAFYHDVVVEVGFLVLVFDTRCQSARRYFPPKARTEEAPLMALSVAGSNMAYQVETTGIEFKHDSMEFCVLMITKSIELQGG